MNQEGEFILWLRTKKRLGDKPARDVVSRCRRIERELDVSLARVCRSDRAFVELLHELKQKVGAYSQAAAETKNVYGPLRRAARLYSEFLVGPSETRSAHLGRA
jgi:hypothetical protein